LCEEVEFGFQRDSRRTADYETRHEQQKQRTDTTQCCYWAFWLC
jgi:hypothetical protein